MLSSVTPLFLLLSLALTLRATEDDGRSPIMKEISAAKESAVIAIGMVDVLSEGSKVMDFLDAHSGYAAEFGQFGVYAVDLATKYLGERVHDIDDTLATEMWRFSMWISALKISDRLTYEAGNRPVYVGPGVDPATEDLRAVMRLLNLWDPEVPEDPLKGGELNVLSQLFARHLHVLSLAATDPSLKDDEELFLKYGDELLKQVRHMNALYRLSFRQPSKMDLSGAERTLIVEYIQDTFEFTRKGVEDGTYPASYWEHLLKAKERILDWKKQQEREEL